MAESYCNDFSPTLSSGIGTGDTSITVSAAAPIASGFRILIDSELMLVTAGGTTTTWTVTRNAEGTSVASHLTGATIHVVLTAGALDSLLAGVLLFGAADPTAAAILIQSNTSALNASELGFSGSVTAGNLLIAVLGMESNGLTSDAGNNHDMLVAPPITDSLGNTWTLARGFVGNGYNNDVAIMYCVANASGVCTVSVSSMGNSNSVIFLAEYGGGITNNVDGSGSGEYTIPSATVTQTYDLVITAQMCHTNWTPTVSGGEVILSASNGRMPVTAKLNPSIGSFTSTMVSFGASPVCATVSFKTLPSSIGKSGDWFLNTTTGVLWQKVGTSWTSANNLLIPTVSSDAIGTYANLPASGMHVGDRYKCTDCYYDFIYDGSAWQAFYQGKAVTVPPILSSWTIRNQGSYLVTQTTGQITVTSGPTNGGHVLSLTRSLPSTPYTIEAGITTNQGYLPYSYAGIGIMDSTAHKAVMNVGVSLSGNYEIVTTKQAIDSSFDNWASGGDYQANQTIPVHLIWYRLHDDGANLTFSFLYDGFIWWQQWTGSRTDYMTTPNLLCFIVNPENGYNSIQSSLVHWKQY